MNLSQLHELRLAERQLDIPQELPEGFYDSVISDLVAFRERIENGEDSRAVESQLGEYETEISILVEYRLRKIMKEAQMDLKSSVEPRNLTRREERLFHEIRVGLVESYQRWFNGLPPVHRTG